jgi:glycosyltransferase involved in cell wall biosynthesis
MVLLANGFSKAGIPTAVVVLRSGGEAEIELLNMLHPDIAVSHAGRPMGLRHLELIRGARYISRQIERAKPQVLFASSSNMGLVTGITRTRQRVRPIRIMKLTNPVFRPRDGTIAKRLYRRLLYGFIFARYRKILLLSDAEQRALSATYPGQCGRFETVANPYVAPAMIPAPANGTYRTVPIVLTLARMMPQKRLDRLLTSFSLVANKAARLVILGDGPERQRLAALADRLGISDRLDMPGYVEDVIPWLRRADLFALSSDYEGLPAAVLEALACGVPVVTTDCFPLAQQLLGTVNGCAVVPRRDVLAFARAIDDSLNSAARADELAAVARPYQFATAIAAHVAIVQSLIAFSEAGIEL